MHCFFAFWRSVTLIHLKLITRCRNILQNHTLLYNLKTRRECFHFQPYLKGGIKLPVYHLPFNPIINRIFFKGHSQSKYLVWHLFLSDGLHVVIIASNCYYRVIIHYQPHLVRLFTPHVSNLLRFRFYNSLPICLLLSF